MSSEELEMGNGDEADRLDDDENGVEPTISCGRAERQVPMHGESISRCDDLHHQSLTY